jgi:hypothetical protein
LKNKKSITKRQFEALPQEQQAKELKKLAKRANVRASLLEESGILNQAYYQAQNYNADQGRLKNRFYEGIKYKTKEAIKEAYTAVTNFLNNKKSTLGGIESDIQIEVKDLIKKGQFDFNTLRDMSEKEKIYVAKEASKQANRQLKELEKAHLTKFAYEIAGQYNEATGRPKNRFYTGGIFKNEKNLNIHIQNVAHFLNSKTSSPQGYEQMNNERLEAFRKKGINIPKGKEKEFYDFLSSEQFKNLGKYADSNQVIETFVDARNANIDADMINREFQEFMNSDMTFDEVQEKLNVAKWQQGGLLH